MNKLTCKLFAASIAASCALAPTVSRADQVARVVVDYTVFLDPPTGFVFVKLPAGWKFVGKVNPNDVARAPGNVVTAMLVDADTGAARNALEPSRNEAARAERHDHPAVIVQRLHARAGYDYVSKFYPHPAWLHLQAQAPHLMMEHPAVIVFRRQQQDTLAAVAKPQPPWGAADSQ
jgi:hypothetical protein